MWIGVDGLVGRGKAPCSSRCGHSAISSSHAMPDLMVLATISGPAITGSYDKNSQTELLLWGGLHQAATTPTWAAASHHLVAAGPVVLGRNHNEPAWQVPGPADSAKPISKTGH